MKTTNTEKSLKERKLAEFREKCNLSIGKGGFITMTPPYCLTETEMEQFISDMADEYEAKIEQAKREGAEEERERLTRNALDSHSPDYISKGLADELKSHLTDKK